MAGKSSRRASGKLRINCPSIYVSQIYVLAASGAVLAASGVVLAASGAILAASRAVLAASGAVLAASGAVLAASGAVLAASGAVWLLSRLGKIKVHPADLVIQALLPQSSEGGESNTRKTLSSKEDGREHPGGLRGNQRAQGVPRRGSEKQPLSFRTIEN